MKKFITTLFFFLYFSINTFAQDLPSTILEGQTESVYSVAFSPDGKTLASGGWDKNIGLWEAGTGKHIRTIEGRIGNEAIDGLGIFRHALDGHTGRVNSVVFSPDGSRLASGSVDNTVRLWDASTGVLLNTLEGHAAWVSSVAFSPDGSRLASGSEDNTVRLWDASTGVLLNVIFGHTERVYSVAFSPDGNTIAVGGSHGSISLWNPNTDDEIVFEVDTDRVNSVVFSPDGKVIAVGGSHGSIRLLSLNGTLISEFKGQRGFFQEGQKGERRLFQGGVSSVAFSPDGQKLAIVGASRSIYLWYVRTGATQRLSVESRRGSYSYNITSVAFSPDGQLLVSGDVDNHIDFFDVNTGAHLHTLQGHPPVRLSGAIRGVVTSVAFSPDGQILANGGLDSTIRLREIDIPGYLRVINRHRSSVRSVVFSPNSQVLASGSGDNTVRLWDVNTGEHIRTLGGHTSSVESVVFSSDGQTLASGSRDGEIRVWNTTTGEVLNILVPFSSSRYLNFNLSDIAGSIINFNLSDIAGSDGETIRVWNATTGEVWHSVLPFSFKDSTFNFSNFNLSDIAWSPDGKTLAMTSSGRISLLDVETSESVKNFSIPYRGGTIHTSAAFSPDGHILAGGGRHGSAPVIQFWDVTTGEPTRTLRGHTTTVLSIAFSPDGSMLASGSDSSLRVDSRTFRDGSIGLWDTRTGKRMYTLEGHADSVYSVAFSPDGKHLASGSSGRGGKPLLLWQLPHNRVRLTPEPVMSPAIGEQFSINVSIVGGENVGGYQCSLVFDPTALRYVESANGDFLPSGAFFVPPVLSAVWNDNGDYRPYDGWDDPENNAVTLGATAFAGVSAGDGTLATVTFEVLDVKESVIDLFDIILTDSNGEHLPQLAHIPTKVIEPTLLPTDAIISLNPFSVLSPAIGEQLTFNVDIAGGQNVADYQLNYDFDASVLKYISKSRGNYLAGGIGNGDGTLETVRFEVLDVKTSTVSVSGHLIAPNGLRYLPTFESAEVIVPLFGDVNRDGVVNILDLVQVASKFGQTVSGDPADVNEDGVVNIVDLVKVAGALGGDAAAPSAWRLDLEGTFTREQVQQWLSEAQQFDLTDATAQRGILYLEQLLAALTPKETALLPNYPNPFNPETWIPYQLAKAADVTVTIYAVDGTVVRQLVFGHQPIGIYQGKSRAAYWDGKNNLGEPVASGVYFYTLTAGDFTATRKMLIRK